MNWTNAEANCVRLGGHLASIHSEVEDTLLHNYRNFTWAWIGFNDISNESTYIWSDGSSTDYVNWHSGEPNDFMDEDCAQFYKAAFGDNWNDNGCNKDNPSFCRFSNFTDPGLTCNLVLNGDCIVYVTTPMNWTSAEINCVRLGGHLASIHSEKENMVLNSYRNFSWAWFGFNDISNESTYIWSDGSSTDYVNWNSGEPNDFMDEDCAQFYKPAFGDNWNDNGCNKDNPSFCRFSIFSYQPLTFLSTCDLFLNGDCIVYVDTPMTWDNADVNCVRLGGHLVSIHSEEENTLLRNFINNQFTWIGFNDKTKENIFVWTDGSSIDYTNWRSGEPNDELGEDCVEFFMTNDEWNDQACTDLNPSFCRLSGSLFCSLTLNNRCYIYVSTLMSWNDAEANCVRLGGHLASIHSNEENSALNNIRTSTIAAYIGCHDNAIEGTYAWTDGTAFNYTYWGSGEPNNAGNEDCCHFISNSALSWNDNECYQLYASICQIHPYTTTHFSTTKPTFTTISTTTDSTTARDPTISTTSSHIATTKISTTTDSTTTRDQTISTTSSHIATTNISTNTDSTTTRVPTISISSTYIAINKTKKNKNITETTIPHISSISTTPVQSRVSPPLINSPEEDTIFRINLTTNSSFSISCNATDRFSISYSWLDIKSMDYVSSSSVLSLSQAQLSSIVSVDAVYFCIASNDYNSSNTSIVLRVTLRAEEVESIINKTEFEINEISAASNILTAALTEKQGMDMVQEDVLETYVDSLENIVQSLTDNLTTNNVKQVSAVLNLGASILTSSNLEGEKSQEKPSTISQVSSIVVRTLQAIENVSSSVISTLETNSTVRISSTDVYLIAQSISLSNFPDTSTNVSKESTDIILPDYGIDSSKGDDFRFILPRSVAKSLTNQNDQLLIATTLLKSYSMDRRELPGKRIKISDIVTITVLTGKDISQTEFEAPVQLNFYTYNIDDITEQLSCVFLMEQSREWSNRGVSTIMRNSLSSNLTNKLPISCNTSHFTSFAVLVTPRKIMAPPEEDIALFIISCVLVSISVIFLVCTLITFCFSYKRFFKIETNIIYFNYGLAILFGMVSFLISVSVHELITRKIIATVLAEDICKATALVTHYSWLSVFSWTLCNGIYVLYKLTIGVLRITKIYPWLMLFGWLIPVPIISLTFGVRFKAYVNASEHCFPSYNGGIIWALIAPILFVLFVNSILLVLATAKIYTIKTSSKEVKDIQAIKNVFISICILTPIFGLSWIFLIPALFSSSTIPQWLFTITNSSLGILYFLVVFLRNREVRQTITQNKQTQIDTLSIERKASSLTAKDKYKKINETSGEPSNATIQLSPVKCSKVPPKSEEFVLHALHEGDNDPRLTQNFGGDQNMYKQLANTEDNTDL